MVYKKLLPFVVAAAALTSGAAFAHEQHKGHKPSTNKPTTKPEETPFGRAADASQARRTILVEMRDSYEFSPNEITVQAGEVVRFVVVNTGKGLHEMVLGSKKELEEHNQLMQENPAMHHD